VTIFDGATQLGTTTATAGGAWTFTTAALSQGSHSFTAKATDAAGNGSAASADYTDTIDTTAPGAPTITSITDDVSPVTGTVSSGCSSNDTTPTPVATRRSSDLVTIFDGATQLGTTTANGSGAWTFTTAALSQGSHSFTAKATDAAGNGSAASAAYTETIDTTAPSAPTITSITDDVSPVMGTVSSGGSSNDTTPTLAGTADATLTLPDALPISQLGTTTANGSGAWTFTTAALTEASHSFTAKATDAAGNGSAASAAYTETIDTTAPSAPTITSITDDVSPVMGTVSSGGSSNDTTPTLAGTADATLTLPDALPISQLGTTTANGSGAWTFTTAALTEASHSFTAKATDA